MSEFLEALSINIMSSFRDSIFLEMVTVYYWDSSQRGRKTMSPEVSGFIFVNSRLPRYLSSKDRSIIFFSFRWFFRTSDDSDICLIVSACLLCSKIGILMGIRILFLILGLFNISIFLNGESLF